MLKPEEWQHIIDYYTAVSPDSLPGQVRSHPIQIGLPLFEARVPAMRYEMPATSLVKVDTVGSLDIFDVHYQKLYRLSGGLQVRDSVKVEGGIVGLERQDGSWLACNIGVLNPNNGKFGQLERIVGDSGSLRVDSVPLTTGLRRPVQAQGVDLNGDGRIDYLVCEFGNLLGELSWLENKGGGRFERHVLRATPGAIKAIVNDYNHDGKPDIWALFAQGDEGVFYSRTRVEGSLIHGLCCGGRLRMDRRISSWRISMGMGLRI
ncbi:FG-GAP repeat domain-containing protein [Puia sp. P3]|uniref:FG-GAP repeat domain-containing protein n=1 Tax=Puia sp. P3 TaxID=3423952 RepID=UPI003D671395